jgi:hypothetical protein
MVVVVTTVTVVAVMTAVVPLAVAVVTIVIVVVAPLAVVIVAAVVVVAVAAPVAVVIVVGGVVIIVVIVVAVAAAGRSGGRLRRRRRRPLLEPGLIGAAPPRLERSCLTAHRHREAHEAQDEQPRLRHAGPSFGDHSTAPARAWPAPATPGASCARLARGTRPRSVVEIGGTDTATPGPGGTMETIRSLNLTRVLLAGGLLGLALLGACGVGEGDGAAAVGPGGAATLDGKADSPTPPYADGTKGACTLLATANGASADDLARAGIPSTAARAILAFRAGADGQLGTGDDRHIDTVAALDAIAGVGPVTLQKLYDFGTTSPYACNRTVAVPRPVPTPTPPPPTQPSGPLAAQTNVNWVNTSTHPTDGDLVAFRLFVDGDYVRLRCYGSGCAIAVAETHELKLYESPPASAIWTS